jgi:hypothetical protein
MGTLHVNGAFRFTYCIEGFLKDVKANRIGSNEISKEVTLKMK